MYVSRGSSLGRVGSRMPPNVSHSPSMMHDVRASRAASPVLHRTASLYIIDKDLLLELTSKLTKATTSLTSWAAQVQLKCTTLRGVLTSVAYTRLWSGTLLPRDTGKSVSISLLEQTTLLPLKSPMELRWVSKSSSHLAYEEVLSKITWMSSELAAGV